MSISAGMVGNVNENLCVLSYNFFGSGQVHLNRSSKVDSLDTAGYHSNGNAQG
jgi:hypothetical protein